MANVAQLKDNNQNQCFPVTVDRAVYTTDGIPAINKPIATNTYTFPALDSASWRAIYVPVALSEGYYVCRISGILDSTTTNTQARLTDARSYGISQTIKLLFTGMQITTSEYTCSFYVSENQASSATYLVYAQETALGGTVTVDVFNADQLYWHTDELSNMVYKPIYVNSFSHKPYDSGVDPSWSTCYIPVKFTPGQYVLKTRVGSDTNDDIMINLSKARSLNTSDLVRRIFSRASLDRNKIFYISISEEEAEATNYIAFAQYSNGYVELTMEVFPIEQVYWQQQFINDTVYKPVATSTVSFTESTSEVWRRVFVPLTLSEGHYFGRITGVLDNDTTSNTIRILKARTQNESDTIKFILGSQKITSNTYEFSFYLNESQAANAKYLLFAQYTANQGAVTIDIFNYDQVQSLTNTLSSIVYKPLFSNTYSREALDEGADATWGACYTDVNLSAGQYVIKTTVGSTNTNDVMIYLSKAHTLNGSDLVKKVFPRGSIAREQVFFVNITEAEAEVITCVAFAQYSNTRMDLTIEIFSADQLYWKLSKVNADVDALPDYYFTNNWLTNKLTLVNNYSSFINGITFPFITDLHFKANAQNSKYLLRYLLNETACSMVICGGDFAPAYGDEDDLQNTYDHTLEYAGFVGHDKWFSIVGNHDYHITDSAESGIRTNWTWGKTYNGIIKPSERWLANSVSAGGYYCVDNDVQKTRFIMLNSTEPDATTSSGAADGAVRIRTDQLSWLVNRINEISGYKIIVFSHIASDSSMPSYNANMASVQGILEAFKNKTTYSGSVTADFSSSTNELICHISGHSHSDDSNVSNNVLSISTTCDAYYQDDGYGATVGTVTEQAFDVYCIDYDARTIKTVRFGRGNDRSWTY